MKRLTTTKVSKKACSLTLAVLFSISPTVLADNQDWARDYIGTLNFKLKDDPDLLARVRKVDSAQSAVNSVSKEVKTLQAKVDKLAKEKDSVSKSLDSAQKQITKDVIAKNKLAESKKAAVAKKKVADSELAIAKTALTQAKKDVDEATAKVSTVETKLNEAQTACTATPTPQCQKKVQKLQKRLDNAKADLATKVTFQNTVKENVKAKAKAVNRLADQITKINANIAKLDQAISSNGQKVVTLKKQLKEKKAQLQVARTNLAPKKKRLDALKTNLELAKADKKKYRQRLIARVLDVNKRGASEGAEDGHTDGRILSNRLGTYHGSRDGDLDGENDGIREGRERERASGYRDGQTDGAARAQREGSSDGQVEGTEQGNIDAATKIGRADGTSRARNSDASAVGTRQGNAAGMQRAITTGNREGTRTGQTQAINEIEGKSLKDVILNGDFAGAFARIIPAFPTRHQGRNYDPNGDFRRKIVNMAFRDGYKARYKRRLRASYENNITTIYNNVYNANYDETFDDFFNRAYPDDRRAGYNAGERDAYNRDYQRHYDQAYNHFRTQFSLNPNRNATEFRQTYARVEESTYSSVYEDIRSASFNTAEASTFANNIAEQTEIYRAKRHAEVSKIYKEKPVLKFESSKIEDAGINGVAARDGVFQPGENTLHSIVVKNFGSAPANNVKVVLQNGKQFKVPSIPGNSLVTVKGVAKANVVAPNGKVDTSVLTVYSPLSAEAAIQGRHFYSTSQGQVNSGDQKRNKVKFPLKLSSLKTLNTPIIGETNGLSVSLINESKRPYAGSLDVTVEVNSNGKIITKGFNPVSKLNSSATLKDATLLINEESDIYTPLTFRAKVSKNGVTLGYLDRNLTTMAKAPYVAKRGKPVVVVNSESSTRDLVDLLSTMGGLSGASVLDVSLSSRNRSTLGNGLKGQTLLLLEKNALKQIDGMLKKSEKTSVILIDELSNGTRGLRTISTFKDAEEFNYNIAGIGKNIKVIFANPMRASGLKTAIPVAIASRDNYKKFLGLSELMKLSNDQILSRIQSGVNTTNFFAADTNQKQLMQMANIRAIDEVMRINKHYKESGGGLSRDKDIADLVKKDKSLLHNRLGKLVDGKARDNNASLFLFAYDFYYTMRNALKHYDPIEDRVKFAVQNRMFGTLFSKGALKDVKDSYKALKKYDKGLYKKVGKVKGIQAPFIFAEENDNNSSRR
jgi:hypothetical protein